MRLYIIVIMFENQKEIFKGYFLMYFGVSSFLSSSVLILIYVNVLHKPFGVFPVFFLFFVTLVCPFIISFSSRYNIMLIGNFKNLFIPRIHTNNGKLFIQGVPNNHINDFILSFHDIVGLNQIIIKEINKGVYIFDINDRIIKFDMRGWMRKEYYIYEYLLTIIQINGYEKIYKRHFIKYSKDLVIVFIRKNGKKRQYKLIWNNKTCLTFIFKQRMKMKNKILSYCDYKNKNIRQYYDFN